MADPKNILRYSANVVKYQSASRQKDVPAVSNDWQELIHYTEEKRVGKEGRKGGGKNATKMLLRSAGQQLWQTDLGNRSCLNTSHVQ